MTRAEHVEWCQERARFYLDKGDLHEAVASMTSDMGKHAETRDAGRAMGMLGIFEAMNGNMEGVRRFIEGFN